jgi:excisionase family DNA binding protein
MDALDTGPTLLGLEDAADHLGTTRRTVERLIARGDLAVVRLPGVRRTLVGSDDLTRLIKASRQRAGAAAAE